MGLITEMVEIKLGGGNDKYYESLGYNIPRRTDKWGHWSIPRGTKLKVYTKDLLKTCHEKVKVKCDNCGKELIWAWNDYNNQVKENNKTYCHDCAVSLFAISKRIENKLNSNGKSFYEWCYDNLDKEQADDIINRWDSELNKCSSKEVCYSSIGFNRKGYWFKCLKHPEHKSELHSINSFTGKAQKNIKCRQCNSIAQYLIDTYGRNALELYWDYNKNTLSPWKIDKRGDTNVWIKCQEKNYHDGYKIRSASFSGGNRCPYCSHNGAKVHPKDSLGQYMIDNFGEDFLKKVYSDKNKKSAFEYLPNSTKRILWKCPNQKHKDFYRPIASSTRYNFRCPSCEGFSKGEEKIDNYLINNKIDYMSQKTFKGLIGLGGKPLSYDFYLSQYNLLIEYQGIQHEKYIKGFQKSKKDFEKQQMHDKRKREYAKKNNIKLLEIWYNCFNDIEFILDEVLKGLNNEKLKKVS